MAAESFDEFEDQLARGTEVIATRMKPTDRGGIGACRRLGDGSARSAGGADGAGDQDSQHHDRQQNLQ
jgi:hypothetical protein